MVGLDAVEFRLCTRGLVASGTGGTDFEALYDLLGGLYVSPLSSFSYSARTCGKSSSRQLRAVQRAIS